MTRISATPANKSRHMCSYGTLIGHCDVNHGTENVTCKATNVMSFYFTYMRFEHNQC